MKFTRSFAEKENARAKVPAITIGLSMLNLRKLFKTKKIKKKPEKGD
jgi:hypothetical protein